MSKLYILKNFLYYLILICEKFYHSRYLFIFWLEFENNLTKSLKTTTSFKMLNLNLYFEDNFKVPQYFI